MSQLLLWDDACDPELDNVRGLALDVEDWLRIWLHRPVGLADWSARLRPHLGPDVNERQWLRFRARLRHHGVPHEETEHDCPGQARLIRVALPPAALEWAKETLERGVDPDDTDEDDMEAAYRMEPEEALRDEPIRPDVRAVYETALDVIDMLTAFGYKPFTRAEWHARLWSHATSDAAARTWIRLLARLRRHGAPCDYEVVENDGVGDTVEGGRLGKLRLRHGSGAWADEVLEQRAREASDDDKLPEARWSRPINSLDNRSALEATERLTRYGLAVRICERGGPVPQELVQDVLNVAADEQSLSVPLGIVMREIWLPGVGMDNPMTRGKVRMELTKRICLAAGLRVDRVEGVDVVWSQQARELREEFLVRLLTERGDL